MSEGGSERGRPQFWVKPTSPKEVATDVYDWENRRMLEMLEGRG